ncbi:MAG TPA: ABC transporter permease [Candidatus Luteococcus avicola]|nr:ABC transporter permease [Candidatus Luteococcus avicola]
MTTRNAWRIVAMREMLVKLTDKTFILGTLSTLVLVIVASLLGGFLSDRTTSVDLAVTDQAGMALAQEVGRNAGAKTHVVPQQVADVAAAEKMLLDGDADALLAKDASGAWQLTFKREPNDTLLATTQQVLQTNELTALADKAGTDLPTVMSRSVVQTKLLQSSQDQVLASRVLGFVFGVLFMMSALTYGMQIAQSVIEEKQSRIVEILTAAIPVRELLAGKIIGNTILAMGQMVLLAVVGLVGASFTSVGGMFPGMAGAVAWFLVFFLAGFLALACIWAAAGAMGTRNEDLQQTSQPLIWLLMIPYMAGFLATGTWRVILSYVPVVSSVLMPARIVAGGLAWWEPVLALVINLVFAALTILVGERIYRRALLQTQGRLSFKDAFQLAR